LIAVQLFVISNYYQLFVMRLPIFVIGDNQPAEIISFCNE